MQSDIKYVKNDKIYKVKGQAWRPRKVRMWLLLPLFLMLGLGSYVIFNSFGMDRDGLVNYKVAGDVDYKVYLKDNDYYSEKFLGKGMQYIASLVNVVRADFSYELDADQEIDANYRYEIVAEAKATERGNKDKVLYEHKDVLKKGDAQDLKADKLVVSDGVDIDYGKYNEYMRSFRNDFGVNADCWLNLTMEVKVDGEVKTEDALAMSIPLSEQTLDIAIDTKAINREDKTGDEQSTFYLKSLPLLITGAVIVGMSLILVMAIIYYYATRYNGDLYEKALHKILKEYDTYIVEGSDTIYELDDVVRVGSFKELLDAQALENAPIVFLEVIPGEKAYFVVNGVSTTYRYTLSRAYQERLASDGEKEF